MDVNNGALEESQDSANAAVDEVAERHQNRLKTLRPKRVSDYDWSQDSGSARIVDTDTDNAPGRTSGEACGVQIRVACRGRGAGHYGASRRGAGGRGARERGSGGRGDGGLPGVVDSFESESEDFGDGVVFNDEDRPTQNIQAWNETEAEASDTHEELLEEVESTLSEQFREDESDAKIQSNYKESVRTQIYRARIKAREICKRKIKESRGFVNNDQKARKRSMRNKGKRRHEHVEDGDDDDTDHDEGQGDKRRRNGPYRYLRERQKDYLLAEVELHFRDKYQKIDFAKRILEREGYRVEKISKKETKNKIMLALSAQAKNKLTQDQYESLRFSNQALGNNNWPSWRDMLEARKLCRPKSMIVTKQGAFYNIRDVVVLTAKR